MLRRFLKAPAAAAAPARQSAEDREAALVRRGRVRHIVLDGLTVHGSIESCSGDGLKIEGFVMGDVVVRDPPDLGAGLLIIGPNAIIHGDVYAKYVFVHGRIEGQLTTYRAEISGSVMGGVRYVHSPHLTSDLAQVAGRMVQIVQMDYPERDQLRRAGTAFEKRREHQLNQIGVAEAMSTATPMREAEIGAAAGEVVLPTFSHGADGLDGAAGSDGKRAVPAPPDSEFGPANPDLQGAIEGLEAFFSGGTADEEGEPIPAGSRRR